MITDYGALEHVSAKDAMIGVLERIRDLFAWEMTKLKQRRNRDHSFIYRLPQELLTEILLLAVDWAWWGVEKLRILASVSTAWRNTIRCCHRFWPVMDVTASEEARAVAMKRNREGPVDVWCWDKPSILALDKFIIDLQTVKPARMRSVLYELRPESRSFMDWLRSNTSNIVDIFIANVGVEESAAYLELPSGGPNLRHVDLRGVSLQWQSPRLSNLHTLCLGDLSHKLPSLDDIYSILSSSPTLERVCFTNVVVPNDQALGSVPPSALPITLPVLKTLALNSVSTAITSNIVPLIRASACHTVIVQEWDLALSLELQETTIDLITKAITLSRTLKLKVEISDGTSVHICSAPAIARQWVYWAHEQPGIDIKLAIPSAAMVPRLWEYLGDTIKKHGATRITSLEVDWAGQAFLFPFALLEHCPDLTELQFHDHSGTTLYPLLQFLGGRIIDRSGINLRPPLPLPSLASLTFDAKTVPNLDDCIRSTKAFLERRYPALPENVGTSDIEPLDDLHLPFHLVNALQQARVETSLDIEKVLRGAEVRE